MRGVAFSNLEGSSDFFGNYDTTEVIDPSNNACSFHISFSFTDVAGTKGPLV